MFKEWLINDIERAAAKSNRVVISDPTGFLTFIVSRLPQYSWLTLHRNSEEMEARHQAQTAFAGRKVVFLCFFPSKEITQLLEFSGVGAFVNFDNPEAYLRDKLYQELGLNVIIPTPKLLLSAKLSDGKDAKWWKGIANKTIEPLDFKTHLHDLIRDPKGYQVNHDDEVFAVLRDEVFKAIGKTTIPVDASSTVNELASAIFSGLINNNITPTLLDLFYWWSNTSDIAGILMAHSSKYKIPNNATITTAHNDHPFEALDRKLLLDISDRLKFNKPLIDLTDALRKRVQSDKVPTFKAAWLGDLLTLLDFDSSEMYLYDTYKKIAEYYLKHFSHLDTAMRHLYSQWIAEPELICPLQELYESHLRALLTTWFANAAKNYQPSQLGLVAKALSANGKIAVLVCDGLRLEIAEAISGHISEIVDISREIEKAKLPSVTENGMSALFDVDSVVNSTEVRFNHLRNQIAGVKIINFSTLSNNENADKLVVMFGDIDTTGEHKGMAALRDINNYEIELADAVKRLLGMGYEQVYLTADHGFVITGILDEASKVQAPTGVEVKERFFVTDEYFDDTAFIRREDIFPGGQYQYYSKTDKPFRTRGAYGYAHGGFTPQECLIPIYCFTSQSGTSASKITIYNKSDLNGVTGQYFTVRLQGNEISKGKRVKILLFNNGTMESSTIVKINDSGHASAEFEMLSGTASIIIQDAQSGEQYDSVIVTKSQSRDLDELF